MAFAWARALFSGGAPAEGAQRAALPTAAAAPAGATSGALGYAGGSGAERAAPPREAERSAPLAARNAHQPPLLPVAPLAPAGRGARARAHRGAEELMCCRPQRSASEAEPAVLTRDDRYQLAVAACCGVAEVAASSPELYNRFSAALTDLSASLRQAAPAAPRRRRGAAGAVEADGAAGSGAGGSGPPAGSEQPAPRGRGLPAPRGRGLPAPRGRGLHPLRGGGRGLARRVRQEHDGNASDDSGDNETVCHKCSEEGDLVCCDGCPHAFHVECLPRDAMAVDCDPWLCPVCTGSNEPGGFVGRPQQPTHRGSRQRARKRARAEGSKGQVAASKKARRSKEGPRFR
jgi:hypothetical protein